MTTAIPTGAHRRPGRPTTPAGLATPPAGRVGTWPPDPAPAAAARPARPWAGERTLVRVLFWWLLAASVAVWWFGTGSPAPADLADLLREAGRAAGMVAGYLLLAQALVVSRVAWLEEWLGPRDLLRWHRWLGPAALLTLLAHVLLLLGAAALPARTSLLAEAAVLFRSGPDMREAFAGAGLLVLLALVAVGPVRRAVPPGFWKLLHRATYVGVYLGYGHQFTAGRDLAGGFARTYWATLYALTATALLWGRVVEPLWLNARHRLRVVEVVWESSQVFSVHLAGRDLDRLRIQPGQPLRWRFVDWGQWTRSHPYCLSAAPRADRLRLTIKIDGEQSAQLGRLRPGTRVLAEGPYGRATPARARVGGPVLFIGFGRGIAPVRALAEVAPVGSTVIYRARREGDVLFQQEWAALAARRRLDVRYVAGRRRDPGPRALLTRAGLRRLVPDVVRRDVYLSGPPEVVEACVRVLRRLHVPAAQIHRSPAEY
ncbi:ferric reductase [Pilimelia terevasa]|uniref:Ferric reductase n=1 Tax=Pilimelia terevasa TaxID=53372 RepID=A0A8J3BS74_9ACTN|nr:ferric reductase-like transmembrane domain-containing protein [Pilimelia terevasa]GGK34607.1 ferric reductase [Pilimelia terevasa]